MVAAIKNRSKTVTIGLVGKYVQLHDAYLSVAEALRHAGFALDAMIDIRWIDSETITEETKAGILSGLDGIIVPGGFGDRGIEGMIRAAQYARENCIPYFGICLGMQMLFERSYEYGEHEGLGLLRGEVVPMQGSIPTELNIPHIGWNSLKVISEHPVCKYTRDGDFVYFVHSFAADINDDCIAKSANGRQFAAALAKDNFFGTQFHPEKSGDIGDAVLRNFMNL